MNLMLRLNLKLEMGRMVTIAQPDINKKKPERLFNKRNLFQMKEIK
jgi:hypothetical protein